MTPAQLATYVRKQTKTNSTTLTDAIIMIYANIAKNDICEKITETDESYFDMPITRNLELNTRNYAFDGSIMSNFKYLEGKLDGTNQKRLIPYFLNQLQIATDEASIVSYMAGKKWGYFISGQEVYVLNDAAIPVVTDGLIMWASIYPKDIIDLTSTVDMSEAPSDIEFGLPLAIHELIARRVIIEHKNAQEKPIPLTEKELSYQADLTAKIKILTGLNVDEQVVPSSNYDDGSNY